MSFCRRDVAHRLYDSMNNEMKFMQFVAEDVAAGRMKPKLAHKIIMWYYQQPDRLWRRLEDVYFS